ncbi:hypothetical protein HRI_000303100 [Hibiscus trionum]|uniref:Uncharacterized protein n=1 Tax=Hibiscus trionum TaxID=183268 RepID=A0A9W7GXE3_HIBTR|nr:hypothetical protein HRI_000303100 [Hibiscus trionum]
MFSCISSMLLFELPFGRMSERGLAMSLVFILNRLYSPSHQFLFIFAAQALDKGKYMKYIPKLEQDLELLRAQATNNTNPKQHVPNTNNLNVDSGKVLSMRLEGSNKLEEILDESKELSKNESKTDLLMASDSEDLPDIFETESDTEAEEREEQPVFLDDFGKFPGESDGEPKDFEDHLRQISMDSKVPTTSEEDVNTPNFDEVDRIFLRAASLLKKKKR